MNKNNKRNQKHRRNKRHQKNKRNQNNLKHRYLKWPLTIGQFSKNNLIRNEHMTRWSCPR
jgi:hypothetical protein